MARTLTALRNLQDDAFEALAPFTAQEEADEEAYFASLPRLCASHDAINCSLCGTVM